MLRLNCIRYKLYTCYNSTYYLFHDWSDDARAEMSHLNVGPGLLSEIFKRFKENMVTLGLYP